MASLSGLSQSAAVRYRGRARSREVGRRLTFERVEDRDEGVADVDLGYRDDVRPCRVLREKLDGHGCGGEFEGLVVGEEQGGACERPLCSLALLSESPWVSHAGLSVHSCISDEKKKICTYPASATQRRMKSKQGGAQLEKKDADISRASKAQLEIDEKKIVQEPKKR